MRTHYRGFDIQFEAADAWRAAIVRSETGKRWSKTLTATLDEGQEVCERRAKNLVDAYLALNGR